MSDNDHMARTDTEFKAYVCDSLRELNAKHLTLEAQIAANTEITKGIEEIVTMGRGMFKFAYRVGSVIRWIGGVAAGLVLLWHWFGESIRGLFK